MSLPSPNLDDRTFKDIFEEAKTLIPKYCPQWTDLNESDPGIALVQLMAWMADMIIYRLNRVPEKNFIKFLELMGVSLRPSQPSKAWVVFTVATGVEEKALQPIPEGTKVSTRGEKGEPIVFETVETLNPTASKIKNIYSRHKERYTRICPGKEEVRGAPISFGEEGIPIFGGEEHVPHILYLGFFRPEDIDEKTYLKTRLKINITVHTAFPSRLTVQWESWDGEKWSTVRPAKDATQGLTRSGEVLFEPLPSMEEREVNGKNSLWIRARTPLEGEESLPLLSVAKAVELRREDSVVPDKGYLSTEMHQPPLPDSMIYLERDLSKDFHPFGTEPKQNDVFYLGSRIFSIKHARISVNVATSESYVRPAAIPEIYWEYYSEKRTWKLLGITAPAGVTKREHDFQDETGALTLSGSVSFICPDDIASSLIQGEENYWIRARIARGNYGLEQSNPPLIKTILINFHEEPRDFDYYLSYNNFSCRDLTPVVKEGRPIKPFEIVPEDPTLYLAFDSPLGNKPHRIYFRVAEKRELDLSRITKEYYSKEGWKELNIPEGAEYFARGVIEFTGPYDWEESELFMEKGYWLRARWKGEIDHKPVRLVGIHLNAVEVIQAISVRNEILGSSTGGAGQTFTLSRTPVLSEPELPKILVKEAEDPSPEDISRFRKLKEDLLEKNIDIDVIEEKDPAKGKVNAIWVEWIRVDENFLKSGDKDRHYTLDLHKEDLYKCVVTFGDGKRGKRPPEGKDNIKCEIYHVGGGTKGNVGKNTITVLETAYPFIESVTNPDPAGGGADTETIEEAKLRGPWTLKHRYRAVTKEDFEKLAEEASGEVGKAKCFANGKIKVIIVPKGDPQEEKLELSNMLKQRVKEYLDERRLITTMVEVEGPKYKDVSIEAEVVVSPQKVDSHNIDLMRFEMEHSLRGFFHPLIGGPEENGWPMGRNVHISEIYYLLEKIEGVDVVDKVRLKDEKEEEQDRIRMRDEDTDIRYFPYLKKVDIKIKTIEE